MSGDPFTSDVWILAPVIADTKILTYLLNVDHPQGGPKARFFLACGFRREAPDAFIEALLRHCVTVNLVRTVRTEFAVKSVYEAAMPTPNGRCPRIRSVWQVADGTPWQSLVTAYRIGLP